MHVKIGPASAGFFIVATVGRDQLTSAYSGEVERSIR
jgi:hypothetical protein